MTFRPFLIAAACLAFLAIAIPQISQADELTAGQKSEVERILRDYLIAHPEVIQDAMAELDKRQSAADAEKHKETIKKNAQTIYSSPRQVVLGNPDGNVTFVEFFDYNCGYCKRAFPDVMKMIERDKDLKLVMKEFPILGPGSVYASRAALASRKQGKYWEFHLAMMAHEGRIDEPVVDQIAKATGLDVKKLKADMQGDEVTQVITHNMQLADSLKIQGTPAFIIDQTVIPGAVGFEALAAAVKQVRDSGGCKLC